MNLVINGIPQEMVDQTLTVAQLLQHLKLPSKGIAVECNTKIVPRSTYDKTKLKAGDVLEIMKAVGGG